MLLRKLGIQDRTPRVTGRMYRMSDLAQPAAATLWDFSWRDAPSLPPIHAGRYPITRVHGGPYYTQRGPTKDF